MRQAMKGRPAFPSDLATQNKSAQLKPLKAEEIDWYSRLHPLTVTKMKGYAEK